MDGGAGENAAPPERDEEVIAEDFSLEKEKPKQAQKSSAHAGKTSADVQNLPTLDGNKVGRKFTHTDARINEILDHYLLTGELPEYVTERQRRSYRTHVRLSERREKLERRGYQTIRTARSDTRRSNIVPIKRKKSKRKTS